MDEFSANKQKNQRFSMQGGMFEDL